MKSTHLQNRHIDVEHITSSVTYTRHYSKTYNYQCSRLLRFELCLDFVISYDLRVGALRKLVQSLVNLHITPSPSFRKTQISTTSFQIQSRDAMVSAGFIR